MYYQLQPQFSPTFQFMPQQAPQQQQHPHQQHAQQQPQVLYIIAPANSQPTHAQQQSTPPPGHVFQSNSFCPGPPPIIVIQERRADSPGDQKLLISGSTLANSAMGISNVGHGSTPHQSPPSTPKSPPPGGKLLHEDGHDINNDSLVSLDSWSHVDPAAVAMVTDLRKEKTDRNVRGRVMRLPTNFCMSMVTLFEKRPELQLELCLRERGNIVAHLVERLGGDSAHSIVRFALDKFMILAVDQSGCIALPRIMQPLKPQQLEPFFNEMMKNVEVLFVHPFGNYIAKHFVSLRHQPFLKVIVERYLAVHFRDAATNKHGSHIIEDILQNVNPDVMRSLIRATFEDQSLLRTLCFDKFANYCVQAIFRFLQQRDRDPSLQSWCVAQVITAASGSPFQQNIMKHAIGGYRASQSRQE